jgi:lysophosphatidylcholine acyltransferase/lyso-PAF acetyltransferase
MASTENTAMFTEDTSTLNSFTEANHAEFPLGERPTIGPEPPVNPFHESSTWNIPQVIKTILLVPLLVIRLLSMFALMMLGYICVKVAMIGCKDPLFKPFNPFRRLLLVSVRLIARGVMVAMGYYYIPVKGKPAHRSVAPIIVSNHIGFVDPIFVFYRHLPVIVSAKENVEMPIIGMFLQALQIIPVDRVNPASRHHAAGNIRRRAMDNKWPHVMLFPEGTTTNGKALISFKTGAFSPGLPVQPMVIKYPHKYVNPCWCDQGGPLVVLFQLMTQFVNYMEVEYLPVMTPNVHEIKNPHEFANRVRTEMARALGVVCTEHNFLDIKLKMAAEKLKQPSGHSLVEFARMEKLFRLDYSKAQEYLEKFSAMDPSHSGYVTYDEFLKALHLPPTQITEQVFNLFDKNGHGSVNFREFVAGLAFLSTHTSFQTTMKAAFKACDVDGDGTLTRNEVESSLMAVFPELPPATVLKLFDTLDLNRDGSISWEEFSSFLQRNPEYLAIILAAHPTLLHAPKSEESVN